MFRVLYDSQDRAYAYSHLSKAIISSVLLKSSSSSSLDNIKGSSRILIIISALSICFLLCLCKGGDLLFFLELFDLSFSPCTSLTTSTLVIEGRESVGVGIGVSDFPFLSSKSFSADVTFG